MGDVGLVIPKGLAMTDAPKNNSILYTVLAAVSGLALGLAISMLGNGAAPDVADAIADPDATVVEIGTDRYVITPEAAEAAGYIPEPTYRVIEEAEADQLAQGMTPSEVQALFRDLPIVYSTYIHQPDAMIEGFSSVSAVVGYAPEGQIMATFTNGKLDHWRWQASPNRWTFVQHPPNEAVQAIKEGAGEEWDW